MPLGLVHHSSSSHHHSGNSQPQPRTEVYDLNAEEVDKKNSSFLLLNNFVKNIDQTSNDVSKLLGMFNEKKQQGIKNPQLEKTINGLTDIQNELAKQVVNTEKEVNEYVTSKLKKK
jgi:hypothetical protein